MRRTAEGNAYIGELARGCELCMRGAKLVLFVSGRCGEGCYYCPLSEKRRGSDRTWVNEKLVRSDADVVEEALRMRALGAGITGGDPALELERTLHYLALLKSEFGEEFHIHMYTATCLRRDELMRLRSAGLDELRFHITEKNCKKVWHSIEAAKLAGLEVGVEIPAFPGREDEIVEIALRVSELGGFLNLNELEFSDTNAEALKSMGFSLRGDSCAVAGSREAALKAMERLEEEGAKARVHLCTSRYKDAGQLRLRLLRTALANAKPYEEVTEEGLLLKGVVYSDEELVKLRLRLMREFQIPPHLIAVDPQKGRIETTREIARELAKYLRKARVYIVEEYPTADRLETEVVPL
jgi:hypothetical protein